MRSRVRFPALPCEISLKGKIPAVAVVWVDKKNLGVRPLLALHPPPSPLTHHRDNVAAPHGRSNLRSRLHSCHAQEGGPRSPQRTCGGIGKKNIKAKIRCLHQRHCCKKPSGLLVCVLGLNVGVEGGTQLCHCCEVHYDYKLL